MPRLWPLMAFLRVARRVVAVRVVRVAMVLERAVVLRLLLLATSLLVVVVPGVLRIMTGLSWAERRR